LDTDFLLPNQLDLRLDALHVGQETLTLMVSATSNEARCPDCSAASGRVHSRYQRTLNDLPCASFPMRLYLQVRRFFCDNPACTRVTFAEQLPAVAARQARRTRRLQFRQVRTAFESGGEGGARILNDLGMPVSPDTLLRLMRQASELMVSTPRVLGVDDWAMRKGQTYGTLLVDLEQHRPVDLLPERSSKSFAQWLQDHPGVEIISRDRGGEYSEGAAQGAPDAIQVADRWHLFRNVGEVLQRLLDRYPGDLRQAAQRAALACVEQPLPPTDAESPEHGAEMTLGTVRGDGEPRPIEASETPMVESLAPKPMTSRPPTPETQRRFEQVKTLQQAGVGQRAIARRLGMSRGTVRRYLASPEAPRRTPRRQQASSVEPYRAYLARRWAEGCRDRTQLWNELTKLGYRGSYSSLWRFLSHLPSRRHRLTTHTRLVPVADHRLSARQAAWLLVRRPEELRPEEQAQCNALREINPVVALVYPLAQEFCTMLRERQAEKLDAWLDSARSSKVKELRNFATKLRSDLPAVRAALQLHWNNGQTEGQVNRLKTIKRAMYGRANFDLLRKRVLGRHGAVG
jgi:transposase